MAVPSADVDELAKFGYKQELDRSLVLAEHQAGPVAAVGDETA
jgi:hypothetical protein